MMSWHNRKIKLDWVVDKKPVLVPVLLINNPGESTDGGRENLEGWSVVDQCEFPCRVPGLQPHIYKDDLALVKDHFHN